MYGAPGQAYVYLNYGVHLSSTSSPSRSGTAAVLVRALDHWTASPHAKKQDAIAHGRPGRPVMHIPTICCARVQATLRTPWGYAQGHRGDLLGRSSTRGSRSRDHEISMEPAIGISVGTEHHWRCYAQGHVSVSGKPVVGSRE